MLRKLFAIQPIVMGSVEMMLIRLAFSYLLWTEFFFGIAQAGQSIPVGLAHFMDLSFLQDSATFSMLKALFGIALVLWTAGAVTPVAAGYLLFMVSAAGALRNSYGNIHHGTQIMGMVMLGYFCGYLWESLKPNAERSKGKRWLWADRVAHQTATWWALQAATATYVIAGVSKMVNNHWTWDWLRGLPNLALHVEKIGYQHYLGNGDVPRYQDSLLHQKLDLWILGQSGLPPYEHSQKIAAILAEWPTATTWIVGSGLFFELFAFWALFSRWHAAIFGIILWVMHIQIVWLMQLEFPMNSWALALLFVNVPFGLMWVLKKLGVYDDTPKLSA
jgi:hypothetical protein